MTDGQFDARIAAFYDESVAERFAPEVLEPTVDVLASLAGQGRALEFAIGTGRVALPLAAAGVEVAGIEMSRAMVAQMRQKPGAESIDVTIGDMSQVRVEGAFSLVYLVFNTITNLLTQREQVACFRNAADHLEPGGHFVIEVGVPRLQRLLPGDRFVPFEVTPEHVGIEEFDVVNQRSTSHHYWMSDGASEQFSSHHRYAWPAECDLMAELAGLELVDRWGNWHREDFTADSTGHISVWRR